MKKTLLIIFFLLPLCPALQAQQIIPVDTTHVKTLRIDPGNAYGASASEAFESAAYIPLETTKESTFGKIDKLEVTEDYFIIFDENTNSILFFDKQGKFQHKIFGGSNKSMEKSDQISTFNVNRKTKEVVFLQMRSGTWMQMIFDFNGNKKTQIPVKTDDALLNNAVFLTADLAASAMIYDDDQKERVRTRFLLHYVKDFKTATSKAFPYKVPGLKIRDDYFDSGSGLSETGMDTAALFTRSNDYRIFKVSPSRVQQLYTLIFPLINAVPKNFLTDTSFNGKRRKMYTENPKLIYSLSNCQQAGPNLLFFIGNLYPQNLICNVNSGTVIDIDRILSDERSYFLPVNKGKYYHTFPLAACDGKFIYTSFSSLQMFDAHKDNSGKGIKYSPALENYFSKGSKTNNPVILQIKLKDNL
jgi:hypothetical protein